jgi:hypothetical protein
MTTIASTTSPVAPPTREADRMRLRRRLRTTPGRLQLLSVVIAGALVALAVVEAATLSAREDAASAVGVESAPQLMAASDLYAALADADATASSALLREGAEPAGVRVRYQDDLGEASRLLVELAEHSGASPAVEQATRSIAAQLPIYASRVELARANSRLDFPVGAAYMRTASAQMREDILPSVTTLWNDAANRLHEDYRAGSARRDLVIVAVVGAVAVLALLAVQVYLARRTRRMFNPAVVVATLLIAALGAWSFLHMVGEQNALVRAQRDGSDAVQLLTATRTLALQAQADSSLALAERGTGQAYIAELDSIVERLHGAGGGGLIATARASASSPEAAASADEIAAAFMAFVAVHDRVRALDDGARYREAVALALSDAPDGQATAARELNDRLDTAIVDARERFDDAARDSRAGFTLVAVAVTAGIVLALVLAMAGLQRRIGEFR